MEREIPTVVVRVTDGKGVATDAAQVWIDGKLVFDHVDGRALSLDPGAHSVRVQLDSGEESTSQLLLHEGEKLRTFDVSFLPEAPSDDALATTVVASDTTRTPSSLPEDASGEVSSGIPTATLVLGAAGAAALGAALYFGIVGLGQEGDYDDCVSARSSDCASEHAAMERSYHVSDAAWILGAVSLGVGGVIWWGQPSDAAGTASTGFMLGTSGCF